MDIKGTDMVGIRIALILCILCTGCASTLDIFYDEQGRVYHVESRGTQHTTVDGVMETDTNQESVLEGIIKIQDAKVVR